MKIHKFPLLIQATQTIYINHGFDILCLQMQNGTPTIWAAVDPDYTLVQATIEMYGTGHDIEGSPDYIGTVQDGRFVWHYFLRHVG